MELVSKPFYRNGARQRGKHGCRYRSGDRAVRIFYTSRGPCTLPEPEKTKRPFLGRSCVPPDEETRAAENETRVGRVAFDRRVGRETRREPITVCRETVKRPERSKMSRENNRIAMVTTSTT